MYFTFVGGSALLHLLAAHPKVVAALGIAATVGALATSMGPHNTIGAGKQMQALERTVVAQSLVDENVVDEITASQPASREEQVAAITFALQQCGRGCAELSVGEVMANPELRAKALTVAAADKAGAPTRDVRVRRNNILAAR
jgi:hypothetical protein